MVAWQPDTTPSHLPASHILFSSSRSTKLTVDLGSLQSVCAPSGRSKQRTSDDICPSYNHLTPASYSESLDGQQDGTLTAEEATQYLELSSKPETCR